MASFITSLHGLLIYAADPSLGGFLKNDFK